MSKSNKSRFEKAKAQILAAALSATPEHGDTYVTMRTIADFTGRMSVNVMYDKKYRSKAVTLKDNKRKGDNGLGMLVISRKIPVSQVKNYIKVRGKHSTLGKHVKNAKIQNELNSVLQFIEANA